jgi:hypothetical protein
MNLRTPVLFLALAACAAVLAAPEPARADPKAYEGGLVAIDTQGSGRRTVEIGPVANGTRASIGGFAVLAAPRQGDGVSIHGIEVLDAEGKVLLFHLDDDADGALQPAEADAKNDGKRRAAALSLATTTDSVRDRQEFRLKVTFDAPTGADLRWQAIRPGGTGGLAGPLVAPVAPVNRTGSPQKAMLWTETGLKSLELVAVNAETETGALGVSFLPPRGTTIVRVTSTPPGTWDTATSELRFAAPLAAGRTARVEVTFGSLSDPAYDLSWTALYEPPDAPAAPQ